MQMIITFVYVRWHGSRIINQWKSIGMADWYCPMKIPYWLLQLKKGMQEITPVWHRILLEVIRVNQQNWLFMVINWRKKKKWSFLFLTDKFDILDDRGWSDWQPFSECKGIPCSKGRQRRIRTCLNPPTINNRPSCDGDQMQEKECSVPCVNENNHTGRNDLLV